MLQNQITFRDSVNQLDPEHVRDIVTSTGFFNKEEISIAVELVVARLEKGFDSGYYFIFADAHGRTIGYTCFGPIAGTKASYDLYWIAVHDDFRGKGIGKQLLEKSEDNMARMGGQRIYIETSSRDQYIPTREFYLACGYRLEAVLRDFYAPADSKCLYVKVLASD